MSIDPLPACGSDWSNAASPDPLPVTATPGAPAATRES